MERLIENKTRVEPVSVQLLEVLDDAASQNEGQVLQCRIDRKEKERCMIVRLAPYPGSFKSSCFLVRKFQNFHGRLNLLELRIFMHQRGVSLLRKRGSSSIGDGETMRGFELPRKYRECFC